VEELILCRIYQGIYDQALYRHPETSLREPSQNASPKYFTTRFTDSLSVAAYDQFKIHVINQSMKRKSL
jgi:hypothetical protein